MMPIYQKKVFKKLDKLAKLIEKFTCLIFHSTNPSFEIIVVKRSRLYI